MPLPIGMDTYRLILASSSLLEAFIFALFGLVAAALARWAFADREPLVFARRSWFSLAVAMTCAGSSAFLVTGEPPVVFALLIAGMQIGFLWHAGFTLAVVRRLVGIGAYPLWRPRRWFALYGLLGLLSALPSAFGASARPMGIQARLVVHVICALLFARVAYDAWSERERPMAPLARRLLVGGAAGSSLCQLMLLVSLPALIRMEASPPWLTVLPAVALVALTAIALGTLISVLAERWNVTIAKDVVIETERAAATTAAAQLDAALGAIGDGAVMLDLELNIRAWNGAFAQMSRALGVEPAVGFPCRAMMDPTARPDWDRCWQEIRQGRGAGFRLVRTIGDVRRTIDVRAAPTVENGDVVGGVCVLRDITEIVELEARFHHAQRTEAVGRLAQGIAHDVNNLLSAISLSVDLAEDAEETAASLLDIRTATERGRELTTQLLGMARQREQLGLERIDLRSRLDGIVGVLRRLIGSSVRLRIELGDGELVVRFGAGHLEQVLVNLVVNAKDAMPSGGEIIVTAERLAGPDGTSVVLAVRDTGVGMPPDVAARAHEPYYTTKGEGEGTGLGLSTCRELVVHAGGVLTLDSVVGRGTTVLLRLPAVDTEPPVPLASVGTAPPRAATLEPTAPPSARLTPVQGDNLAIVVDDDPLILRQLDGALRRAGYEPVPCADGLAALEALRARHGTVAIIISDVAMPRLDGPSWVRIARADGCVSPVLFISGYVGDLLTAETITALNAQFLEKPFTRDTLLAAIERTRREHAAVVTE